MVSYSVQTLSINGEQARSGVASALIGNRTPIPARRVARMAIQAARVGPGACTAAERTVCWEAAGVGGSATAEAAGDGSWRRLQARRVAVRERCITACDDPSADDGTTHSPVGSSSAWLHTAQLLDHAQSSGDWSGWSLEWLPCLLCVG